VVGDIDHFKDVNDRHGHAGGDETLRRLAEALKASKRRIDVVARIGGEEFAFLMPDSSQQGAYIAAERLRRDVEHAFVDQPGGVTISFGVASFGRHGQTPEALMHSADQALYSAKELGRNRTVIFSAEVSGALAGAASQRVAQRESYLATVMALSEALDLRDAGIAEHSRTVGRYSELTAQELGLPAHVVERIRIAGTLHDIGKIGVSESVLNKQGPLDEGEWAEIRRHPEIGARILDSVNAADIRGWVLAHHERPDGRGYPFGAQNGAIPLEAKIIAVAEAYESMTSPHPYRLELSDEQARDELVRGAGSQFDVDVVQAFLAAVDRSAVLQATG
jgi:diguanylate cyclase (GGDEF)-like protein